MQDMLTAPEVDTALQAKESNFLCCIGNLWQCFERLLLLIASTD